MAHVSGISLAIVGSGNMAKTHARHWAGIPEAKLVAIATHDAATAQDLACAEGAAIYGSLDELLAAEGDHVNVVDICTPTPTHKTLALSALAAGKHLLLEKPMARTVADCDEIIAAASQAKVVMMVAHVVRYFPEFALAKAQVDSGAIGIPAAIRTARLAGFPKGGWNNWYADPALSGGVIMDMIIHDFDWLLWTFGPVDRVFAKGLYASAEHRGKIDYALVTLHHVSGALSHVTGSWAHTGGFRTTFEICGDGGMLEHDSALVAPLSIASRQTDGAAVAGVAVPESPMAASDDPYCREIRHFADCVLSGRQPDITLDDARAAVQIAAAAIESIISGQPVTIAL